MIDLRDAKLTDLLPRSIGELDWVKATSEAWRDMANLILDFVDEGKVYTGIEQAQDVLLDILAVQFRAPRYRQDYDIETKRRLVKASLPYFMTVGTKASVENIMRDMYGNASISEWFEYDGTPGCFRIKIEAGKPIDIEEMLDILSNVKRTTAHLDMLQIKTEENHRLFVGFASVVVGVWSGRTGSQEDEFDWLVDANGDALMDAEKNILSD